MKTIFRILTLFLIMAITLYALGAMPSFAKEEKMSSDSRLEKALKSYEKALEYIERGDKASLYRFGRAKKMYEHAEDYLLDAEYLYKKLGYEHDIDVSNEVTICQTRYRALHVKVKDMEKAMKK